jgi:hypothetical protein
VSRRVLVKVSARRVAEHGGDRWAAFHAMLAPFECHGDATCPPQYRGFIDLEDHYRAYWEAGSEKRIRMPDGRLLSPFDDIFRAPPTQDGRPVTLDVPTHLERIDVPIRDLYSFGTYMAKYPELQRHPDTGRFGYWGNPNGKWHSYRVGGCEARPLLARAGTEAAAEADECDLAGDEPPGWLPVYVAQFADIDLQAMARWATSRAENWWEGYRRYVAIRADAEARGLSYQDGREWRKGPVTPENLPFPWEIDETLCTLGLRQPQPGVGPGGLRTSVDVPFEESDFVTAHAWYWDFHAYEVLDDTGFHKVWSEGSETSEANKAAWGSAFKERYLDGTPSDTLLVVITRTFIPQEPGSFGWPVVPKKEMPCS